MTAVDDVNGEFSSFNIMNTSDDSLSSSIHFHLQDIDFQMIQDYDEEIVESRFSPMKSTVEISSTNTPWTPTANLKLLLKAASPDIRSRNGKTDASDAVCFKDGLSMDEVLSATSGTCEPVEWTKRKEKSLGLLCHR